MDEVDFYRDQENESFGAFLLETIACYYGCRPEVSLIAKHVYKYTDCGAWIAFDSEGIKVGTIVEGSDAEYSERISLEGIEADTAGAVALLLRFKDAIENCEAFSDVHFDEGEAF